MTGKAESECDINTVNRSWKIDFECCITGGVWQTQDSAVLC